MCPCCCWPTAWLAGLVWVSSSCRPWSAWATILNPRQGRAFLKPLISKFWKSTGVISFLLKVFWLCIKGSYCMSVNFWISDFFSMIYANAPYLPQSRWKEVNSRILCKTNFVQNVTLSVNAYLKNEKSLILALYFKALEKKMFFVLFGKNGLFPNFWCRLFA